MDVYACVYVSWIIIVVCQQVNECRCLWSHILVLYIISLAFYFYQMNSILSVYFFWIVVFNMPTSMHWALTGLSEKEPIRAIICLAPAVS